MNPLILCHDAFYETSVASPEVRLPRDESPHCYGGVEWWYYTGRLLADDGSRYGIHAVVFHVPRDPLIRLNEAWVAHYAVLDVDQGSFAYDQRRILGPGPDRSMADHGFDLDAQLVQVRGFDGSDELTATLGDGRFAVNLQLHDVSGAVLHQGDGYVPYGDGGRSFYYSRPSMAATGTLELDGTPRPVTGDFWFDRQWGLDLTDPRQPWDWFSIRFDDGSRVMLYIFPADGATVAFGTYVPTQGSPVDLEAGDFVVTPFATWDSPRTGIRYDVAWTVDIDVQALAFDVVAVQVDQEIDARATTLNTYWEGLCEVAGTQMGQAATGYAYVEQANGGAGDEP